MRAETGILEQLDELNGYTNGSSWPSTAEVLTCVDSERKHTVEFFVNKWHHGRPVLE